MRRRRRRVQFSEYRPHSRDGSAQVRLCKPGCRRDARATRPFLLYTMAWRFTRTRGWAPGSAMPRPAARRLTMGTEIALIASFVGGVPERSKGTDCKSVGSAFEGSNPSPSTNKGSGHRRQGTDPLTLGDAGAARAGENGPTPVSGCAGVAQW